jgi:hypothetical protein
MSLFQISALFLVGVVGCGNASDGDSSEEPLNWKQVRGALESNKVQTIREFFVRLSNEPVDLETRKWLADVAKQEKDYIAFEKHLALRVQNLTAENPQLTQKDAEKLFQDSINWRKPNTTIDAVKKVYLIYSQQPTKVERIKAWGAPVHFSVYTDENGMILGWRQTGQ